MNKVKQSSSKSIWTTEMTTNLIYLYENYPVLYNMKSKDYHNRNLRNKAISEIVKNLSEIHPEVDLTESIIKSKIHGIRSQYMAELNKVKKSEASGVSPDDIYQPKLWCFEILHFLHDSGSVVTVMESNLEEDSEVVDGDSILLFDGNVEDLIPTSPRPSKSNSNYSNKENYAPTPSVNRGRKRKAEDGELGNLLTATTRAVNDMNTENEAESDLDIFAKFVKSELKEIQNNDILENIKETIVMEIFQAKRDDRAKRL